MSRARLLVRRSTAHRGLLLLVALLVATVTAALGTTAGTVRAAEAQIVQDGLTRGGAPGVVEVTTRLAPPEDAGAQDDALRRHLDQLFAGASYDVARQEVPDDDSDDPFVRWTLTPDVAASRVADLKVLAAGSDQVLDAVLGDDTVAVRGATVTGDLGERAADATAAVGAASAVTLVPMLLLALAGAVAVTQVARLLAGTREGEVRLLVSRGASPGQVTLAAALEACAVALVGAVVGVGVATVVLVAQGAGSGAGAGGRLAAAVAPAAVVTALVAVLVLAAVGGAQARAAASLRPADASGRGRQAAAWGTVVLVVAAAGVTTWLLRRYGSPLVPTPQGGQTDPAAAAAPALVLAAAAVVAVALLGPLSRAWATLAARRSDTRVLAARQVARRLAVTAVPVVLVVLAAGSLALSAAYAGTARQVRTDATRLATGSDVRVVANGESPGPLASFAELPGVAAVAPALTIGGTVDQREVSVTGLPVDRIEDVARTPASTGGAQRLRSALTGADPFEGTPALPATTGEITMRVSGRFFVVDPAADATSALGEPMTRAALAQAASGSARPASALAALEAGQVRVRIWLGGADGRVVPLEVGAFDVDLDGDGDGAHPIGPQESTHELTVEVPSAAAESLRDDASWRVLALDAAPEGSSDWETALRLHVDELVATTDDGPEQVDVADAGWAPASSDPAVVAAWGARGEGMGLAVRTAEAHPPEFRMIAAGVAREAAPAVVSRPLAELLDLDVGEQAEIPVGSRRLVVEVADIVDAVPGSQETAAAMLGLGDLQAAFLRLSSTVPEASEVWVRAAPGADSDAALGRLGEAARQAADDAHVRDGVQVTTAAGGGRSDAASPVRQAFGVAALAAVLLALVGVAAVTVSTLRERRAEVAVLRAVGMPPRAQGNGRALELVVVTAAAAAAGAAAGLALAAATVPGLAEATLTGFAVIPPAVTAVSPWAALVPGLVLLGGLAGLALAVRAQVVAQAQDGTYREEVR